MKPTLSLLATLIVSVLSAPTPNRASLPDHHPLHPRNRDLQSLNDNKNDTQALRATLLSNYDRGTFPFTQFWQHQQQHNSTSHRTGLPVLVGLNFHRVFEVNVKSSVADLIVWVRQQWIDPRLSWDPEDFGGLQAVRFWVGEGSGPGGEMSEIWTPDLQLWNQESPLSETLADAHAVVSSDGSVFWSRPGHVKPVCKFQGLEDFPFETLTCTMEMGSWSYSGLYLRPIKLDEGVTIGSSETAGEAFAEFSLASVECEEHVYPPYPGDSENDWPVLMYHMAFQRAWQPYARGYLFLQILLNVVAFCSFWLPPHIGERMSLNITSVLASVASELVVASNIPAASELTWFSKFSIISLLFSMAALMESAAVIYFYYHTGDDLVPRWVRWFQQKLGHNKKKNNATETQQQPPKKDLPPIHPSSIQAPNHMNASDQKYPHLAAKPTNCPERVRSVKFAPNSVAVLLPPENANIEMLSQDNPLNGGELKEAGEESSSEESLEPTGFGNADVNVSGLTGRPSLVPSFTTSIRTRKSIKTILGRDADDFKNAKEMENNLRWQKVAHGLDDFSRVFFPVSFSIALAIVLAKAENL